MIVNHITRLCHVSEQQARRALLLIALEGFDGEAELAEAVQNVLENYAVGSLPGEWGERSAKTMVQTLTDDQQALADAVARSCRIFGAHNVRDLLPRR